MIKKITAVAAISVLLLATACKTSAIKMNADKKETVSEKKIVVYQVFTRLFGNKNTTIGTSGYIASLYKYDSVELLCITADTVFSVTYAVGNLDVI